MNESEPVVDVVMRCKNEMPYTERALEALASQRGVRARVLFLDCGSVDGSREIAQRRGVELRDVDPAKYVPGVVLNQGMEHTRSAIVAFINADAVALDAHALEALIEPLRRDPSAGASFARQIARPDADPYTQADYERAFGARAAQSVRRGVFFSMAAAAVRRRCWEGIRFDPTLSYSEDVDWVRRIGAAGWRVEYAASARFEHSHRYDLRAQFRRRRGEGRADRAIFRLGAPSLVGDLVRPLAGALLRDVREGRVGVEGVATRVAQASGYFAGRR